MVGLIAGGCTPAVVRIPVNENLINSSEISPIQAKGHFTHIDLQYADYSAEISRAIDKEKDEGFPKTTHSISFTYTVHSKQGQGWQVKCTAMDQSVDLHSARSRITFSNPKDWAEFCDITQDQKTDVVAQMQFEKIPSPNFRTPESYHGEFLKGQEVVIEFHSIQIDASGHAFIRQALGFDVLAHGQTIGAIQGFFPAKDPKIWILNSIPDEQRRAIAIAVPALLMFAR
jgi:hypothetical protein